MHLNFNSNLSRAGLSAVSLYMSLFAASPAHAAPIAQISCAHDQLTADQLRQMADLITLFINERPLPTPTSGDESEKWIDAAVANCAARYGWTDNDRENAKLYSALMLFHVGFRADPMLSGVNFAALDRFAEQLRPNGDDSQLTSDEKRMIRTKSIENGVEEKNETAMKKAAFYVASVFKLLEAKQSFASGSVPRVAQEAPD